MSLKHLVIMIAALGVFAPPLAQAQEAPQPVRDYIENFIRPQDEGWEPAINNPFPNKPQSENYWWEKVEIPGTVCGNGSQYKFFVSRSMTSDNVLIVYEPGGACWDYESCSGNGGVRGAANPNGIPDDHMNIWGVHLPIMFRFSPTNPFRNWNMIFVPYCTGDVHTGNATKVYEDPTGENEPLTYHHAGHANNEAMIDWIDNEFRKIPKMMVTGCSAGGAGSQVNYYFLRDGLPQVDKGYLLNDSGPIFPTTNSDWSIPLHDKIRESWNLDPILDLMPPEYQLDDDLGNMNTAIADLYPEDRLAITYFQRDYNYSLYSYERFYDYPPKEEIHSMWWDDTVELMSQYDTKDNLAYYIPYWRDLNSSHCALIGYWTGTEIEEDDMRLDDFVDILMDNDQPLQSFVESVQPDEDLPGSRSAAPKAAKK